MNSKLFFFCSVLILLVSCGTRIHSVQKDNLIPTHNFTVSSELNEISSLEINENRFFGINDSGGETKVYAFNATHPTEIQQEIHLKNANNVDWEATAKSDSLFFIADFGNNLGERKDLKIYYFQKNHSSLSTPKQEVTVDTLAFFYPEQKVFENHAYNHDFDAESLIYLDGKLHFFTKEWKSQKTKHYTLDLVKGKQPAWLVERFDVGFLVTGADIIQINKSKVRLALVGYNRDGEVFLMLTEFSKHAKKWLHHAKTTIKLGVAADLGQVEGIAFKSANEFCISAEAIDSELGKKAQSVSCFQIQ